MKMAEKEMVTLSDDAFLERMNNFVAQDPSPRNPRISTHSSYADRIEAAYQADRHSTWGYVIYRTTYENDTNWVEIMRRLRAWTEDAMDMCNGQDVLDRMTWTIFDDKEHFDGADVTTIRHHFQTWTETAVQSEQPRKPDGAPADMGRSPRYKYCIQVDAEALKSCVHDAPPPPSFDENDQGWVKVVDKEWILRSEHPIWKESKPDPNVYDAIDGVTDHDVGWVKCPFPSVMTEYYMLFQDHNVYVRGYRRPPAVVGYPWN
jgi:hypothetical protein